MTGLLEKSENLGNFLWLPLLRFHVAPRVELIHEIFSPIGLIDSNCIFQTSLSTDLITLPPRESASGTDRTPSHTTGR